MRITIEYCTEWNYKRRAVSLAAKLQRKLSADVELIASSGGVYEIVVDGQLIYSKKSTGTFPDDQKILGQLG